MFLWVKEVAGSTGRNCCFMCSSTLFLFFDYILWEMKKKCVICIKLLKVEDQQSLLFFRRRCLPGLWCVTHYLLWYCKVVKRKLIRSRLWGRWQRLNLVTLGDKWRLVLIVSKGNMTDEILKIDSVIFPFPRQSNERKRNAAIIKMHYRFDWDCASYN